MVIAIIIIMITLVLMENDGTLGPERVHHTLLQIAVGGRLPTRQYVIMHIAIIRVRIYRITIMNNDWYYLCIYYSLNINITKANIVAK